MTIADIYEAALMCPADTLMADAFRIAVGLPRRKARPARVAAPRASVYGDGALERLMAQSYGVRGL